MKRKLSILFLIVVAICSCVLAFGCEPQETHEHNYATLLEKTDATCSATGKEVYACSCGKKKTVTVDIDKTKHDYDENLKFDQDKHWQECKLCQEKIEETAHTFEESSKVQTKDPTCNEQGEYTYTCTCGKTKTESIPSDPTLHNFAGEYLVGDNGHYQKCSKCETPSQTINHEFTIDNKDQEKHWKECKDCHAKTDEENHEYTWDKDAYAHFGECDCGQEKRESHEFKQGEFECSKCNAVVYTVKFVLKENSNGPSFGFSNKVVEEFGLVDLGGGVFELKVIAGKTLTLPVAEALNNDKEEYYNSGWKYGSKVYKSVKVDNATFSGIETIGTVSLVLKYSTYWTPFY